MRHARAYAPELEVVMKTSRLGYEDRKRLLMRSQDDNRPRTAIVAGAAFEVDLGVFSPACFESPRAFAEMIDFRVGERFLEIGCGCGAIAVLSALRGASSVVATDISRAAVDNTIENAALHKVGDRLTALVSDVYDGLARNLLFDTIFWNSPWMVPPVGMCVESLLERSISDPGYEAIERYLKQGVEWLAPGGRLLLGFADFGDEEKLARLIEETPLNIVRRLERPTSADPTVQFLLYEFAAAR